MRRIMQGEATPSQLAGFLVALRAKGATVDEIVGFRDAILEAALPLPVPAAVLDHVGTGGQRYRTVHITSLGTIVGCIRNPRGPAQKTPRAPCRGVAGYPLGPRY